MPARSAVKVHRHSEPFERERDVYLRLLDRKIDAVLGHAVPQLIAHDDELLVREMSIVTRPFVLDFGGAYLDRPPDFSEEALAEWRLAKQEQFETDCPHVVRILAHFRQWGIHIVDVNPGNIGFARRE